jgi:RING-variant domain
MSDSSDSDRWWAAGFSHVTYRRIDRQAHTCSRNRMSSHQRKQPAAAADTDEQEQEQEQQPQCRICLDGPDPDLGRLIRPCLCSGTVSVSTAKRLFFPTHSHTQCTQKSLTHPPTANRITISHRTAPHTVARTRRLSSALEKYLCKFLRLLCLSTMPLPLPLCPYQDSRPCHQPRFVLPSNTL